MTAGAGFTIIASTLLMLKRSGLQYEESTRIQYLKQSKQQTATLDRTPIAQGQIFVIVFNKFIGKSLKFFNQHVLTLRQQKSVEIKVGLFKIDGKRVR